MSDDARRWLKDAIANLRVRRLAPSRLVRRQLRRKTILLLGASGLGLCWAAAAGVVLATRTPFLIPTSATFMAAAVPGVADFTADPPSDVLDVQPSDVNWGPFASGGKADPVTVLCVVAYDKALPLTATMGGAVAPLVASTTVVTSTTKGCVDNVVVTFVNPLLTVKADTKVQGTLELVLGNNWATDTVAVSVQIKAPVVASTDLKVSRSTSGSSTSDSGMSGAGASSKNSSERSGSSASSSSTRSSSSSSTSGSRTGSSATFSGSSSSNSSASASSMSASDSGSGSSGRSSSSSAS